MPERADARPSPPSERPIELRRGCEHVRVECDGAVLGESRRPVLLLETGLPTRFYLPPDDVDMTLLEPSPTRSRCPLKGEAVYWRARTGSRADLAWSYPDALEDVAEIRGLIAFFDERVDVTVDGRRRSRPRTRWSPADG